MRKTFLIVASPLVLVAGIATAAAIQPKAAPPPPESPAIKSDGDCEVNVPQLRQKYPELTQMLLTVNFDGSEKIFRNPQQMVNYYVSEDRTVEMMVAEGQRKLRSGETPERYSEKRMKRLQQQARQQLRRDTVEFRKEFKGPCKKLAWSALGGSEENTAVIDETAAVVAALPEETA